MEKSFAYYVKQYGALPSIGYGANIKISPRYRFLVKTARDLDSEIIKADIISLFISDLTDIWSKKYYNDIYYLLEIDGFSIYQSIGFLEFLHITNDVNFSAFYNILFEKLNEEIGSRNYKNWFFIFDMISYISHADFNILKIKYSDSLVRMLLNSKNGIGKFEFEKVLKENLDILKSLEIYVKDKYLINFLNKCIDA